MPDVQENVSVEVERLHSATGEEVVGNVARQDAVQEHQPAAEQIALLADGKVLDLATQLDPALIPLSDLQGPQSHVADLTPLETQAEGLVSSVSGGIGAYHDDPGSSLTLLRAETLDAPLDTESTLDPYNQFRPAANGGSAPLIAVRNSAPVALSLIGDTIAEGAPNGTLVGALQARDADAREAFIYVLTDDADGRFGINDNAISVRDESKLDYEAASSHSVTVEVTDSAGHTLSEAFNITVLDVQEPIYGTSRSDAINGGLGSDLIDGRRGDDTLNGGVGDDLLDGSSGDDTLYGGDGNDLLVGGAATGTGKNTEVGGDDTLYGEAGDDVLIGGTGDDDLNGGLGADEFYVELDYDGALRAAGNDRIQDFSTEDSLVLEDLLDLNGDGGIDIEDLLGHITVSDGGPGGNVTIAFDGGGSVTLEGIGLGSIVAVQDLLDFGYGIEVS